MFINNFDPVAFNFFAIEIRWYSLAYIFGILFGWIYTKKLLIKDQNIIKVFDDFITYLIIGIILGGRLGYILFYNIKYYLNNLLEIFFIWEGGMSFHGGLIGVIISTYIFGKKYEINKFVLLDYISITAPIGIFLGRLANFINGELVGKMTNVSWGVIFPNIDNNFRHPSQIYEAFLEGIVLFLIMNVLFFWKKYKPGICSFMFLIFYGTFRIIAEFFREPDSHIGYVVGEISMGMVLSIIMILAGVLIYKKKYKN